MQSWLSIKSKYTQKHELINWEEFTAEKSAVAATHRCLWSVNVDDDYEWVSIEEGVDDRNWIVDVVVRLNQCIGSI